MSLDRPDFDDLFHTLRSISPEALARLEIEFLHFKQDVAAFAASVFPAAAEETDRSAALPRRMLEYMVASVEPDDMISPSELADAIGERNRRSVRAAGRYLVGKGCVTAETEPCDSAEGERVLGYVLTEGILTAFDDFLVHKYEKRKIDEVEPAEQNEQDDRSGHVA
jgi:hypothetical protein